MHYLREKKYDLHNTLVNFTKERDNLNHIQGIQRDLNITIQLIYEDNYALVIRGDKRACSPCLGLPLKDLSKTRGRASIVKSADLKPWPTPK